MDTLILKTSVPAVAEYRIGHAEDRLGGELGSKTILDLKADMPKNIANSEDPDLQTKWLASWAAEAPQKFDIVWTQDYREEIGTIALEHQARGAEMVVDIDDLFDEIPTGNPVVFQWNVRKRRAYEILLDAADRVVCSTPFLADRFGGTVAPNFIEIKEWAGRRRQKRNDDEVLIVCNAGGGRVEDFLDQEAALRAALDLPHVKMLFMGSMPDWAWQNYKPGKVIYSTWMDLDFYKRALQWIAPDVVVSPMQHHNFNLAKSNLKWLEAGAVGACFVGERWGEYERTVKDGVTGILADGPEEWRERLVEVCQDHDLRHRVALTGQRAVYSEWTWPAVEADWRRAVLGEG